MTLVSLLLILGNHLAYSGYYDNQIFIALKTPLANRLIDSTGEVIRASFYAEFAPLLLDYQVASDNQPPINVSAPFFKAKNSLLQKVILVTLPSTSDLNSICKKLNGYHEIEYAEMVPRVELANSYIPDDLGLDSYEEQWYLHKIEAFKAWGIGRGDKNISVAIVDDAIDIDHTDLKDVIWVNPGEIPDNGVDDDNNGYIDDVNGYDVAENDPNPRPDNQDQYHGTHVAGLAAAETDNNIGIASIGFGVSIIPVKIMYNSGENMDPYSGIIYAVNAGADIINCSWGGSFRSKTYEDIIKFAQDNGSIIVAAAGNDGRDLTYYPAAYPGVISVGSTMKSDRLASFSNYTNELSICAPGYRVTSTIPDNLYENFSGTSMSTPIVSGLLGLMKSHMPEITNEELVSCLLTTADPMDIHLERYRDKTGAGRINAYQALLCVDNLKNNGSGITEAPLKPLHIYPNPAHGTVYVMSPASLTGEATLYVKDLLGRQVEFQKQFVNQNSFIGININNWAAGVYIVKLKQDYKTWQGKLVVN